MDIDEIRKDIPNLGNKLFLNSAGASLMPKSVVQKIEQYLHQEEEFGGYKVEELRADDISNFYREASKLLGCHPENIAFTSDATDAYIKALSSIHFEKGDVIITSDDDYASNHIQFISLQKRIGIEIERINNLENGDLDISHFYELINKHEPKLVAITHVPTNSGLIQNVEAIGEICKNHGILYLVDACQSVGQLNVNVQNIKCDFLTTTGRKFLRGPRGTGFLYVSDRILNENYSPLLIDGGGAIWTGLENFDILQSAKRFQTWEAPYALIIGLSDALSYANTIGIDNIQLYNHELMKHFRKNLMAISGVRLYDYGSKTSNILTFRKDNIALDVINEQFDLNNVYFSVSKKQWGFIDFEKKGVDWVIRLSPHYFNTTEEMDTVSKIIDGL